VVGLNPVSPLVDAIRAIYGTASALNDFINGHIEALKSSEDSTISRVGYVLEATKLGFSLGYITPVAVVAIGQLLLGNPLTAIGAGVSMFVSPVAITCAAVGAIWMGWGPVEPGLRSSTPLTAWQDLPIGSWCRQSACLLPSAWRLLLKTRQRTSSMRL